MLNHNETGKIVFDKLWDVLADRGHNKHWLRQNGINANTVDKLVKNENVTTEKLGQICELLNCNVFDIMEYKRFDGSIPGDN